MKIVNFKKEEDKNFVDRGADWLNDVRTGKAIIGFYFKYEEDGTFQFDWYGDNMKLLGFLDYAKVVISNYCTDQFMEED